MTNEMLELFKEHFYYSPTSPSALRYKIKPISKPHLRVGDIAGWLDTTKGRGYYRVQLKGKTVSVHRVVWMFHNGTITSQQHIDHIDGNTINNKIDNLREVTNHQNMLNQRMYKNNSSGVTGVKWDDIGGRWFATWKVNGRNVSKTFSAKKYGYEKAKELAIATRLKAINVLRENGIGYTDRHGLPD